MLKTLVTCIRLAWLGSITPLQKFYLLYNLFSALVRGVTLFAAPLALSLMVKAITAQEPGRAMSYFWWLLAASAIAVLNLFIFRRWFEILGVTVRQNLKSIYYEKILRKPYSWHLHNSVGYFSSALENVTDRVSYLIVMFCYDHVAAFTATIAFFIYAYTIQPLMSLYFIACFAVMFTSMPFIFNKRLKYQLAASKAGLSYGKTFLDFLYNIRSVKKMNLLDFTDRNLGIKNKSLMAASLSLRNFSAWMWGFLDLFVDAMFLVPTGYFIWQFVRIGQGADVVVILVMMQGRVAGMGEKLMWLMGDLSRMQVQARLLAEHLTDDVQPDGAVRKLRKWKRIMFNNTGFEFSKDSGVFVHKVPDFTINRGDHIAVTGRSGEGKSTFLNLLTRQFTVCSGSITVDGVDYRDLPDGFFDDNFTYISQDVELFDMTLYDNIVLGKRISGKAWDKIVDGCCINELIERMNGNPHTDIGEKGVKVSGGEKQRINLARGLLLDREILVLDEITANLDPATTKKIWDFIFDCYGDKTIIAVSHEKRLLAHVTRRIEFKQGVGCQS